MNKLNFKIFVDADACPRSVRDVILRASERKRIETTFVANKFLQLPHLEWIKFIQVSQGLDVADGEIVKRATAGDLVITQDIPLAALLVADKIHVLGLRGEKHTTESIGERLSLRNFSQDLRDSGAITGGPSVFGPTEIKRFADSFNALVDKLSR